MITFLDPISDLTQPFFFYSVVFSILLASLTYITVKILKIHNPRFKSFFYMIPLFLPLVVYAIFPPSYISYRSFTIVAKISNPAKLEDVSIDSFSVKTADLKVFTMQVFSITGLLCLTGLIAGTVILAFLYVFGSRIVCWLQGVVELMPEEEPELLAMVRGLAGRAGISMPRIGITEDLRPNAFTIGYGKNAMIVFSLGLLKMLDGAELEAVVSHEIAHIKNQDFHFNALTSALKIVSFFNPLVYLLSSAIKKEREFLADNTGMKLIERPWVLGLALKKIWENSKGFSRGLLRQRISSFFIASEIRHVRKLLATHPSLESRLNNIAERTYRKNASRGEVLRGILACALIIMVIVCVYGLSTWTHDTLTQMRTPVKEANVISLTHKGAYRLVISLLTNFIPEEAAKDRGKVIFLSEKFDPEQLTSSPLYLYTSVTSARSHPFPPFYLSRVSVSTYSWILTSIDIIAVAIILSLFYRSDFGKAIKKLLK
ncbi:hypothetical protein DRO58_01830 [Candidatus Bathyarchaeota archaeon]|nr:MAG: hypothetical protein DRO58_01830 [Candidatus Bathyarchaeota archaeon]